MGNSLVGEERRRDWQTRETDRRDSTDKTTDIPWFDKRKKLEWKKKVSWKKKK